MRRMWEYVKSHRYGFAISAITIAVSAFIGTLGGRLIRVAESKKEVVHDTLYMQPSKADSLLQDISTHVREINAKIPVKKKGGKRSVPKKDTIRVDATIHLDKQ